MKSYLNPYRYMLLRHNSQNFSSLFPHLPSIFIEMNGKILICNRIQNLKKSKIYKLQSLDDADDVSPWREIELKDRCYFTKSLPPLWKRQNLLSYYIYVFFPISGSPSLNATLIHIFFSLDLDLYLDEIVDLIN